MDLLNTNPDNLSTLLSWLTFLPLIGMCVVLLLPASNLRAIKITAGVFTFIPLVLATQMYFGTFDKTVSGYQMVQHFEWIKALGINYSVGVDG